MRVDHRTDNLLKLLDEVTHELSSIKRYDGQEEILCTVVAGRVAGLFPDQQSRASSALRRAWFNVDDYVYGSKEGQIAISRYQKGHLEDSNAERTFLRNELIEFIKRYLLDCVVAIESNPTNTQVPARRDTPDLGFVKDERKRELLTSRWHEATSCEESGFVDASYFMLASFLEGVLHCWIEANSTRDQKTQSGKKFAADKKDGRTSGITKDEWTLSNFIAYLEKKDDFDPELVSSLKRLGQYRNYIHPARAMNEKHRLTKEVLNILFSNIEYVIRWIKGQCKKVPDFLD